MRVELTVVCSTVLLYCAAIGVAAEKQAAPDEAGRAAALAEVRDIFQADYQNAKTPQQQIELVGKILDVAANSAGDAKVQFALYSVAEKIAIAAGDVPTFLQVAEALDQRFTVDVIGLKTAGLTAIFPMLRQPSDQIEMASRAERIIAEAVAANQFDAVERLSRLAIAAARKAGDRDLIKSIVATTKQAETIQREAASIAASISLLKTAPTDPKANQEVGEFECFFKGDWETGLSMLALGGDAKLADLAKQELLEPADSEKQLALGNLWWDEAEKREGNTQAGMRERAAHWYRRVLPTLSGFDRKRIETRLGQVVVSDAKQGSHAEQWLSENATYTASSKYWDGHFQPLSSLLTEGGHLHSNQFAFSTEDEKGAWVAIDLKAFAKITRITIENRITDNQDELARVDGLTLWLSDTTQSRGQPVWQAAKGIKKWDITLPKPLRARYVILGLPPNVKSVLHLAKVRVYGYPE